MADQPSKTFYYLTHQEVVHYQRIIERGYKHYIVQLPSQRYIVFPVVNKEYIGIAWPTVTGKLDGAQDGNDVIFDVDSKLQNIILPLVPLDELKVLLFPRFI